MQNVALSTYSEDLEKIIDDIKSLKREDAEASSAVIKADKKLHRLQLDVHMALKDEEVSQR